MMKNENDNQVNEQKKASFGERLKFMRETKGWERKEVAAQLRLSEKKISMMEQDRYPSDLPVTFIRGYLRSYGRLLQMPEHEISKAIEHIKPKHKFHQKTYIQTMPISMSANHNYFTIFFTLLVTLTMFVLVGMWWYTHSSLDSSFDLDRQISIKIPDSQTPASHLS